MLLRNKQSIILLGAALLLAVVIIAFLLTRPPTVVERVVPIPFRDQKPEMKPPGPNNGVLILFRSEGCHHCIAMAEEWEAVKKHLSEQGIAVGEQTDVMAHNLPGYPIVRWYPSGYNPEKEDYAEYRGPRKANDIITFVNSILNAR